MQHVRHRPRHSCHLLLDVCLTHNSVLGFIFVFDIFANGQFMQIIQFQWCRARVREAASNIMDVFRWQKDAHEPTRMKMRKTRKQNRSVSS